MVDENEFDFVQFSQVVGEWLENQILILDWAYFHCPGATLVFFQK